MALLVSTALPEPARGPSCDRFLSGVELSEGLENFVSSLERSGQWQLALCVFSLLPTTRTSPDVVSYGLMMDAQSAGR